MDDERTVEFRREALASQRPRRERATDPADEQRQAPGQAQPQIVYVQAPPPAPARVTPVQQAQLDNGETWRTTTIICIVLLVTVLFAWVIPILLIATLVSTGGRMKRAQWEMAHGVTEYKPPEQTSSDFDSVRGLLAAIALVLGVPLLAFAVFGTGTVAAALLGILLIGTGGVLIFWRKIRELRK